MLCAAQVAHLPRRWTLSKQQLGPALACFIIKALIKLSKNQSLKKAFLKVETLIPSCFCPARIPMFNQRKYIVFKDCKYLIIIHILIYWFYVVFMLSKHGNVDFQRIIMSAKLFFFSRFGLFYNSQEVGSSKYSSNCRKVEEYRYSMLIFLKVVICKTLFRNHLL